MRRLLILLALGLGGCGVATVKAAPAVRASAVSSRAAADSTNRLATALLRSLGAGGGNLVFSPYSIQAALAMAYQGAVGTTATEIGRVLNAGGAEGLAASEAALARGLAASIVPPSGAKAADAAKLNVANGLWVQSGLALAAPFSGALASEFGASPQALDFKTASEAARKQINGWVADRTAQRIKDLMPAGSITGRTRLVLANALFLKANWARPFVKSMTARRAFFPAAGGQVRIPFMTQPQAQFAFARRADYRAVELPYLDSRLSMLVVMPSGPLAQFEHRLTAGRIAAIERSLQSGPVDLAMPRFHLAVHTELNGALARLGMPTAFSDFADFSGITKQIALTIQKVMHGADLRVDEAGTVAAAATGISFLPTSAPAGPVTQLVLDHPFLALIRDQASGTILFVARVADPLRG
jgi:serpin B